MSRKSFWVNFLFITSLLIPSSVFSQGETAVSFLRVSPSATLNGMGGVGVALPNSEPFAFFYNPAQLGFQSRTHNFGFQFYPSKSEIEVPYGIDNYTFNNLAINGGYKFENGIKSLPLSLGFGYMRGELNYGENIITNDAGLEIGRYESKEYYHAFAVGVGLDFYVNLNFGLTYKNISSKLGPAILVEEESGDFNANENAFDFGVLMTIPTLRFLANRFEGNSKPLIPYCDVSFGYAITNIGGKVEYLLKTQADPLPRTALIGYAISTGINYKLKDNLLRMISLEWSSEANDLLVIRKAGGETEYQGLLGDINLWDNFIFGKSDDQVESRHGVRFQFFELIGFSFGKYNMRGGDGIGANGFSLNLSGFVKAMSWAGAKSMNFAAHHFDLQYSWSQYDSDEPGFIYNTSYQSITFSIYGF